MHRLSNQILQTNIPAELFDKLKNEVNKKQETFNDHLAGNLEREENLDYFTPEVEPFITEMIKIYDPFVDFVGKTLRRLGCSNTGVSLKLKALWVNHMKQYEFNPMHNHDGCFSFIMFIQIPFKSEEMLKKAPGSKGNHNLAGSLTFFHHGSTVPDEFFTKEVIFPDEEWEGKCLIFPASLFHSVNPFYGTEKTRITISGNVYLDTLKSIR